MSVRKLTKEEQVNIRIGLNQTISAIMPDYSTPLYRMLASPVKNTLLYVVMFLVVFLIYSMVIKRNPLKILTGLYGIIGMVFVLFFVISNYYSVNKNNQNIIESMKRLPKNATYMDYVSQTAVMSNRLGGGRGGGSLSSGILGGIIGSGLSRRRRR